MALDFWDCFGKEKPLVLKPKKCSKLPLQARLILSMYVEFCPDILDILDIYFYWNPNILGEEVLIKQINFSFCRMANDVDPAQTSALR